ncbi:MAG: hypothetical protein AB7P20_06275 [Rhizobiaceae bacterium]
MTPEERKRLCDLVGRLDSDQVGEREAALGKVHVLRGKVGWPGFADLWRRAENAISPEDFERVEKNLAQWKQAHAAKEQENTLLKARVVALVSANKSTRAALWTALNFKGLVKVATVLAFVSGGGWWWWQAQAAPDQQPVASDPAETATNAALRDVLSRMRWKADDSAPLVVTVNGAAWWVIARGSTDAGSHADAWGKPIERHCLQIFAEKAVPDAGAYRTPAPYLLGIWLRWPLRAAECRMPGTRGYS